MPDMEKRCAMGLQPFQSEQGAILAIALIFVCILAISGTMAYQMTANEFLIARNFDDSREALNAATAGIEEARVRMGLPNADTYAINDPYSSVSWTASPTSLQSDLSYQMEIHHKTDAGNLVYYGYENPASDLTIKAFPSSTPREYRPVDIITSYGTGDKSGITIRAEVVHFPGPPILATLYAENDVIGDSTNVVINGVDQCGVSSPKANVYFYATTSKTAAMSPSLTSGSININVVQGITVLKEWATDTITTDQTGATFGTSTDYKICHSAGDLVMTSVTGYGTLLVEGHLTMKECIWNGLILASEGIAFQGNTSGLFIDGAVLANWEVYINNPSTSNGTSVQIRYDSCKVNSALEKIPLRVLSWEDLSITE